MHPADQRACIVAVKKNLPVSGQFVRLGEYQPTILKLTGQTHPLLAWTSDVQLSTRHPGGAAREMWPDIFQWGTMMPEPPVESSLQRLLERQKNLRSHCGVPSVELNRLFFPVKYGWTRGRVTTCQYLESCHRG